MTFSKSIRKDSLNLTDDYDFTTNVGSKSDYAIIEFFKNLTKNSNFRIVEYFAYTDSSPMVLVIIQRVK